MNKTLAITAIALVAVVMILGTASLAMAGPGASGGKVVKHRDGHTSAGSAPVDDCFLPSQSNMKGKLWFVDINGDTDHQESEPTFCLKPKKIS